MTNQHREASKICVTQNRLFVDQELPEGFVFQPDFLSPDEERGVIQAVQLLPFGRFQMHGVVAKRRIVHFGLHYSFGSHQLAPAAPLPTEFEFLRVRAAEVAGRSAGRFLRGAGD